MKDLFSEWQWCIHVFLFAELETSRPIGYAFYELTEADLYGL
jgi:hypothetical protein